MPPWAAARRRLAAASALLAVAGVSATAVHAAPASTPAPTVITATPRSATQVELSWRAPARAAHTVRILVGGRIRRVPGRSRRVVLDGLRPATRYRIDVRACPARGTCSPATRVTVSTLPAPVTVHGAVEVQTGNCMPRVTHRAFGDGTGACAVVPGRGVRVRFVAATSDIRGASAGWARRHPAVAEVVADAAGRFAAAFPGPGQYSVFADDGSGFTCASIRADGVACPVEVGRDETFGLIVRLDRASH